MISGVSSYGPSSIRAWQSAVSSRNALDGASLSNNLSLRPGLTKPQEQVSGFQVELTNIPEILQYISKKIEDEFKVKVKNSDDAFSEEELVMIYNTLQKIPKGDLKGVKMIVKNRSLQLNFQTAPSSVFGKVHQNRVYGAYDESNERIYIFELDKPDQLEKVLKHEIGHSVHCKMSFENFYKFAIRAGWRVAKHEQRYIPGNELYNIGLVQIELSPKEALEAMPHFDFESLRKRKDKYNKFVMMPPDDKKDLYHYKDPFETFATVYEKLH